MSDFTPEERSVRAFTTAEQEYLAVLADEGDLHELRGIRNDLKVAEQSEKARGQSAKEFREAVGAVDKPTDEPVVVLKSDADPKEISLRRQRGAVIVKAAEGSGNADIVLLPTCDPRWLPAPEAVVRGSLFGLGTHRVVKTTVHGKPVKTKERISFTKDQKPCGLAGDASLYYRGPALDQGDFDVWIRLLELAKDNLAAPIFFRMNAFLTELGRNTGGKSYGLLIESLERLAEGKFSVSKKAIRGVLDMSLVREVLIDTQTGRTKVTLDPKAANLFGTEKSLSWTKLQRQQRQALVGKEAALWLHACYSSHARPIPLHLTDLRDACGTNAPLSEFKRMLEGSPEHRGTPQGNGALDQLVRVGFLKEWKIEGGFVKVVRDLTNVAIGQSKFLAAMEGISSVSQQAAAG